jgi:hypothetical protein
LTSKRAHLSCFCPTAIVSRSSDSEPAAIARQCDRIPRLVIGRLAVNVSASLHPCCRSRAPHKHAHMTSVGAIPVVVTRTDGEHRSVVRQGDRKAKLITRRLANDDVTALGPHVCSVIIVVHNCVPRIEAVLVTSFSADSKRLAIVGHGHRRSKVVSGLSRDDVAVLHPLLG